MIERVIRGRWVLVGLFLLAMAALTPSLMTAVIPDNALTVWFLQTDPQLETYNEFQSEFGNDEVILMLVDAPEGAFTPPVLGAIDNISKRANDLEGVARVHSLLTIQDAWDEDDELVFRPLLPAELRNDTGALAEIEARSVANPLLVGRMISEDAKQTMLWIEMDVMGDIDAHRDRIVADVRTIGDEVLGEREHAIGGLGVIYSGLNVLTQRDFGIFLGLGYLLMFVLLAWVFRSWRIVLATIGVISIATTIALGLYGLGGHQLNMVSVVIPTLIIILGVADAVHVPAAFVNVGRDQPELDRRGRIIATMRRIATPVILTTLTTMGGFLALASSPMATIRHLGIFSAIGIGVAMLATFVLMPIAFGTLREDYQAPGHRHVHRFVGWAESLVRNRFALVAAVALAITVLAAAGASTVRTDTYTIGYLPDDYWVVEQHEQIVEEWGHYSVVDFIVRPLGDRTIRDPEVVDGLRRFVDAASEHELIRQGLSIADVYRRMADVYAGEPSTEPLTPEQIEQLSLFIEPKAFEWDRATPAFADNILAPVMTQDGSRGRVTLTGAMISAKTLEGMLAEIDAIAERELGGVAELEPAGYPPLYVVIIDYVMSSQIRGFFIALCVIFLMMLIGLRSLRLALISLPPNIFPVLVMMGVMGALDITLDVATATVGAIVIGISIDDSVHFLHHWKEAESRGLDWSGALTFTFERAGIAAGITTILLALGFPILMFASLKTVFYFGLLTTVSALAALFADLFILPLLLRMWPPRKQAVPD